MLSVFRIDEASLDESVRRITTALAASRDEAQHFNYVTFDEDIVTRLDISMRKTDGRTPDEEVNGWHVDFENLSAARVASLTTELRQRGEVRRELKQNIKVLLREFLASERCNTAKVSPKLLSSLEG